MTELIEEKETSADEEPTADESGKELVTENKTCVSGLTVTIGGGSTEQQQK